MEKKNESIEGRKEWEEEHIPALVAGVERRGEERGRKEGRSERVRH